MFKGCSGLTTIHAGTFNVTNVTNSTAMFTGCILLVGRK
ncbi:MAG: hypothetical protein E7301_04335 [Butyrivibrio sp.]|nr:hypothetical protein [Butyrivibrio sp.]